MAKLNAFLQSDIPTELENHTEQSPTQGADFLTEQMRGEILGSKCWTG